MRFLFGSLAFICAALGAGCSSTSGQNVEYITVVSHDQSKPAKIVDRKYIRAIVSCYERRVAEAAKFPWEFIITIHYDDGRVVGAMVGHGYLKDDDGVSYRLSCDMTAILRDAAEMRQRNGGE